MKSIIITAMITWLAVGTAAAQSCDSKAVGANGKPLHGAAKMSFVKKCKRDACGSKAVSAAGEAALRCGQEQLHDEVHEGVQTRVVQGLGFDQSGSLDAPKPDGNGGFTSSF